MKTSKLLIFLTVFLISDLIFASFGPEVSKYNGQDLKWIDEPVNYFVMFKSNLDENYNCVEDSNGSTYSVDISHIPGDAYIERAFLIWTGTHPLNKKNDPTDNEVELSYISADQQIKNLASITASPKIVTDPQGFEFNSVEDNGFDTSYFVYRVDVTNFFQDIHEKGKDLGLDYDGYSLYGDYSVKEIDCFKDENHPEATLSDWSIVLIYSSKEIAPKNVYIYDNFQHLRNEYLESELSGFELDHEPEIRMTFFNHLGNLGISSVLEEVSEGIWVKGDQEEWLSLFDDCNPFHSGDINQQSLNYTDIFNSISSFYGWNDESPFCIGGNPENPNEYQEKNIEADTFIMDSATDSSYATHFSWGTKAIKLKYGANVDDVLTDMVIVSTDQLEPPYFHKVGRRELVACTPSNDEDRWCHSDLEYTFAVRLQAWGYKPVNNMKIKAEIPFLMTYVEGSTEYSTDLTPIGNQLTSENWTNVPDKAGGSFPLAQPTLILDELKPCAPDEGYLSCENTLFLRFSVKIDPRAERNEIFEMLAYIEVDDLPIYRTNSGIPIKLTYSENCVENQEDIDMSECGRDIETKVPDNDTNTTQDTELNDDSQKSSDGCICIFL